MRLLASGALLRDPEQKTAASGRAYTKAMARVQTKQRTEQDPDSLLIFLTAFGSEADALAAMRKGDAIAFSGAATITAGTYQDRQSVTVAVVVDKLLDAKRPPRHKEPKPAGSAAPLFDAPRRVPAREQGDGIDGLAEDLPW